MKKLAWWLRCRLCRNTHLGLVGKLMLTWANKVTAVPNTGTEYVDPDTGITYIV